MLRGYLLVVVVLVAACTTSSHPTAATPKSAAPSPSEPPGKPVVTPPPVVDLPVSTVSFSCRLPVTRSIAGGDYAQYEGQFITFPAGSSAADPQGVIHSQYLAQDFITVAKPPLEGLPQTGPPFYDLAQKRWLPVGAGQASPDGSSYAYAPIHGQDVSAPTVIHVVDVARGSEKTFNFSEPGVGAFIAEYDGKSVYLSNQPPMGPPGGVWRLDVASGRIQLVSSVYGGVEAVRNGYVWVGRIDPRDPEGPQTGRSGPRANSLVRVDLATGQETVWYFAAGHQVFLLGFDKTGNPVITKATPPDFFDPEVLLLLSPNGDVRTVYGGGRGLYFYDIQGDLNGRVWLGGDRGIYMYEPSSGLRKVFSYMKDTATEASGMHPAGFCL